jgi:RimJ/RimL family protein N-acetyltransferase
MEYGPPNLTLRRASLGDSESLLHWRNDPATRAFSLDGKAVAAEEHKIWLDKTLQDSGCLFLIGEIDEQLVGMARINLIKDSGFGRVSINMNPEFRGRGLSRQLLKESLEISREIFPTISQYVAEIHVYNLASKKLFESLGFAKVHDSTSKDFESYSVDSDFLKTS